MVERVAGDVAALVVDMTLLQSRVEQLHKGSTKPHEKFSAMQQALQVGIV